MARARLFRVLQLPFVLRSKGLGLRLALPRLGELLFDFLAALAQKPADGLKENRPQQHEKDDNVDDVDENVGGVQSFHPNHLAVSIFFSGG